MRQPGVVTRSSEKFDTVPWGDRNRVRTDLNEDAIKYLKEDDEIPDWIPDEEKQLWMSSTIQDPCVVESEHGSRWATSLRSISNFYRPKERDPPCIRGSILDVHPPTLGERLGFNFDRRRAQPNTAAGRPARFARKTTRKDGHPVRQESPNAVSFVNEGEGDVSGMDEYVGFLVENDGAREIPKHRKGWRRFMKRAKA